MFRLSARATVLGSILIPINCYWLIISRQPYQYQPIPTIISPFFIITSPDIGFFTSTATTLPKALSDKLTIIFPPSIISDKVILPRLLQSQSFLVTDKSCSTSHNRLVR